MKETPLVKKKKRKRGLFGGKIEDEGGKAEVG